MRHAAVDVYAARDARPHFFHRSHPRLSPSPNGGAVLRLVQVNPFPHWPSLGRAEVRARRISAHRSGGAGRRVGGASRHGPGRRRRAQNRKPARMMMGLAVSASHPGTRDEAEEKAAEDGDEQPDACAKP